MREATEELLIHRDQIEIVGELEKTTGPGMIAFYSFIGVLNDYEGTWSEDEVERVFTIPLEWILEHDPDIYKISLERHFPDDFPELFPDDFREEPLPDRFLPEAEGLSGYREAS